jgi:hypothetical protein
MTFDTVDMYPSGVQKMGRPTQTKEWYPNSPIAIIVKLPDIVLHSKSNAHGNVETNKRSWSGLNATVIQGEHNTESNESIAYNNGPMIVTKGTRIWSCTINQRGTLSSIGLSNENVTVIVHIDTTT